MATFDDLIRAIETTGERIVGAIDDIRGDLDRLYGAIDDIGSAGGGGDGADAAVTGSSPGKAGGTGDGGGGLAAAAALAGRAAPALGAAAQFLDRPVQLGAATGAPADTLAGIGFKLEQMGARIPIFNTVTGARTDVLSREAAISDVSSRFEALAAAGLEVSDESIVRSSRIAFERNERALRMRDRVAAINVRAHFGANPQNDVSGAGFVRGSGIPGGVTSDPEVLKKLDELIRVTKENKMGGSPGIK